MTHIALEGGCFVLSANQFCRRKDYPPPPEYIFAGTEEELTPDSVVCAGGSVIISPSGTILSGPNYDGEALITADLGTPCFYFYFFICTLLLIISFLYYEEIKINKRFYITNWVIISSIFLLWRVKPKTIKIN